MTKHSKIILFGTIAGRSFGYLRELTIVFLFGISSLANDVVFLLTSFDALASVFAYGTITMISINYVNGGKASFSELRKFFYGLGFLYALLCSALIYFSDFSFSLSLMVPFVALLNIDYSMAVSIQQVESDFTWTAFTSVIINTILIVCIIIYPNVILFVTILVLGLLLRNFLVKKYNDKKYAFENVIQVLSFGEKKNILFTVFGTGLFYLVPVLDRFTVSTYGQIALFNYGDRVLIFAAVLVNGAFIYPSIVSPRMNNDHVTLKSALWNRKIFLSFCFVLSCLPYFINRITDFEQSGVEVFVDFTVVHFIHFLPFLVFLTTIQVWTVQSKYMEILKLSLLLIFSRVVLFNFASNILDYTAVLFIVDIIGMFYLVRNDR